MWNRVFGNLSIKLILWLVAIFLFLFSILIIFFRTNISLDTSEVVTFQRNSLTFIVIFISFFVCFLFLKKYVSVCNSNLLFLFFSSVYVSFGIYMIINSDSHLRADALSVFNSAIAFNKGNFDSLSSMNYVGIYPQQLGIITLERIILSIISDERAIFFGNLIFIIIINFILWKTVSEASGKNSEANNITILLSFCFLPQFFFIFFAYGQIPGLTCLVISLYFFIKNLKEFRILFFIVNIIFIGLSCLLRSNYMIAAIAMAIIYLIIFLEEKKVRLIFCSISVLFSVVFFNKAITTFYENESSMNIGGGMPKIAWVTMGLQDSKNTPRLGGWYNGYSYSVYMKNNGDEKAIETQTKKDLNDRVKYLISHPRDAFAFFSKKSFSTWGDPWFQSVWSGPLENANQHTHTQLLKSIYSGGRIYSILTTFLNVLLVIIYFFSFRNVIRILSGKLAPNYLILFCCLYFLGGIFFHLLWETKSQYTYPYVFLLIPVACYDNWQGKSKKDPHPDQSFTTRKEYQEYKKVWTRTK